MLSRIISARDAGRAELPLFMPISVAADPQRVSPERVSAENPSSDEAPALRERIRQLESEVAAAKRDSFEAGRRQGEQQGRAEIAPVIERMNGSLNDLVGVRHLMRGRAEKDVVQLALLIARRILHREVNVDPNALVALARVVFEKLARAENYRVTVHPGFASAIQSALSGSLANRVQIEPDPSCAMGTLIVQSEEGVVDASVDSQLEEITRGLTDRLAQVAGSK